MREIKFRAWVEDCEMVEVHAIALEKNCFHTESYSIGSRPHFYNQDNDCYALDDSTLMQYTGLMDDNGKEIYPDDIVRVRIKDETKTPYIAQVVESFNGPMILNHPAHREIFGEKYRNLSSYCSYGITEESNAECEVIGNIYENPELLED